MIWILFPSVGAFIGWITNVAAIRLLFHPRQPVKLFGGIVIQGLLPRRRRDLAAALGQVVENELLSREQIMSELFKPGLKDELVASAAGAIGRAAAQRLPAFLPGRLQQFLLNYVEGTARREMRQFVDHELPALLGRCIEEVDIAGLVRQRIESLNLNDLESLAIKLARRELRHIELLGGVLGLLVGLAQALIYQVVN